MNALDERLAETREQGRAALIGYLPAGYPSVAGSEAALEAMVANGVDIVEVGLPYTDPLMDGPVIAEAVQAALDAGTTTDDVMRVTARIAAVAPTLVMTYWNPIERYGIERFADGVASAGGVGVITADLPVQEAGDWIPVTDAQDLSRVFVVAPSSTDARLAQVAAAAGGFVYAASLMGVTGTRESVSSQAEELVARVRAVTDLPVGVGLGVSTPEQAAEVARFADAVIVGSAFVRRIAAHRDPERGAAAAGELAAELAQAVRR